jgi:hypothetical protein
MQQKKRAKSKKKNFVSHPFAGLFKKRIGPRDIPSPMGARQPFEPTILCHLQS